MLKKVKLGISDSGRGAEAVKMALQAGVKNVSFLLFQDHKYFPYGKQPSEILQQRLEASKVYMRANNIDHWVIGCHTLSIEYTLSHISQRKNDQKMTITTMIDATKLAMKGRKGEVLVYLATKKTIEHLQKQALFYDFFGQYQKILFIDGGLLIEAIEKEPYHHEKIKSTWTEIMKKHNLNGDEDLLLGCTHFSERSQDFQFSYDQKKIIDPVEVMDKIIKKNLNQ